MDHFENPPLLKPLDEGWDLIGKLLEQQKFQRVFGACVGYLKGYTAGAQLIYLSTEEIEKQKVDEAYATKITELPNEREPKLNASLIGCLG